MTADQDVGCRESWNTGATFVDLNNDGHLDLYVCAYASPNHLFMNDGKGRFQRSQSATLGPRTKNYAYIGADQNARGCEIACRWSLLRTNVFETSALRCYTGACRFPARSRSDWCLFHKGPRTTPVDPAPGETTPVKWQATDGFLFQGGKTGESATWREGDFNEDAVFNSRDLVDAVMARRGQWRPFNNLSLDRSMTSGF